VSRASGAATAIGKASGTDRTGSGSAVNKGKKPELLAGAPLRVCRAGRLEGDTMLGLTYINGHHLKLCV